MRRLTWQFGLRAIAPIMLVSLVATSCGQSSHPTYAPKNANPAIDQAVVVTPPAKSEETEKFTLLEYRKQMENSYTLRPDKRFLSAVAEIHHLLTDEEKTEPVLSVADGKWTIKYKELAVGTVTDVADFGELNTLLISWCQKIRQQSGIKISDKPTKYDSISERINKFAPDELMTALSDASEKWQAGDRSRSLVTLAADALVDLQSESMDLMGMSDALAARALCMVALSADSKNEDALGRQCLLADSLGYAGYAAQAAKQLSTSDPLRLYLQGSSDALRDSCRKKGASKRTKYLYLKLLSRTRELEKWRKSVQEFFHDDKAMTLPLLRTYGMAVGADSSIAVSSYLMAATINELEHGGKQQYTVQMDGLTWTYQKAASFTDWMMKDLLTQFEDDIAALKAPESAAFFDHPLLNGYYRGYFYSGIYGLSHSYMLLPEGKKLMLKFARSLQVKNAGPAKQLELWLVDRVAAHSGTQRYGDLNATIQSLDLLGSQALLDIFEDTCTRSHSESETYGAIIASKSLLARIDSRPETRTITAEVMEVALLYPWMANRIVRINNQDNPTSKLNWYMRARLTPQVRKDSISGVSAEEGLPPDVAQELHNIAAWERFHFWNDKEDSEGKYKKLLEKTKRKYWAVEQGYCDALTRSKKFSLERAELKNWLAAHKGSEFQVERAVRNLLAHACLKDGAYEEGLQALGTVTDASQFDQVRLKVNLLNAAGKKQEAEEWALEYVKYNPEDTAAILLAVQLYWQSGQYAKAAQLLTKNPGTSDSVWRSEGVGRVFFDSVSGTKYLEAARALAICGIDRTDNLGALAETAYRSNRPDLAIALIGLIKPVDDEQKRWCLIRNFKYMRFAINNRAASAWLLNQLKGIDTNALALQAFESGQTQLLWLLPDNPNIWLLRAADAAGIKDSPSTPFHERALRTYYQTDVDQIGPYLLNMSDGKKLFSLKLSKRQLCVTSFFVGWKALVKRGGDYPDDSTWMRLAIETNEKELFEFKWALHWLNWIENDARNNLGVVGGGSLSSVQIIHNGGNRFDWNMFFHFQ